MVATYLKRWVGNRILNRSTRKGGLDLSKMRMFPSSVSMPLRRHGLDPVPELAAVRETEPVHKLAHLFGLNIWVVSGHAEAKYVLSNEEDYSHDIRPLVGSDPNKPSEGIGGLGFTDPPDHTRLRKLLTPEFTKRKLARLEPAIEKIVNDQLDQMEAKGPVVDIVSDFAFNVPFLLIADLLGVEEQDRDRFRALGPARFDLSGGGIGVFGSASESRDFLFEIVRKQRTNPGDGLIGSIIREQGDDLDDIELGGLADGVFLGGYETSASMLALGTLVLLRDPANFEMIRNEPGAVAVSLSGADRDKQISGVDAEDFYPRRTVSAAHLAFGHGMHRCVGAELARMELRAAFSALAHRFPDLSLAVPEEQLRFRDFSIVYGVESLPVHLHAASTNQAAV